MLIIGHRGSAGTHPHNSIAGLREAIAGDADMIEFDIRLTKDKHPVLAHDFHLLFSHKMIDYIGRHTLSELQKRTAGSNMPIVTLEQALKTCHEKIFVNIEVKERRAVAPTYEVLQEFCTTKSAWQSIMISSFNPLVLSGFRKKSATIQLAMVHSYNPLSFIVWEKQIGFTAVGFHRLRTNFFALEVATRLGIFTYAYTVNRPEAAQRLYRRGIDGVVTDYPRKLVATLKK